MEAPRGRQRPKHVLIKQVTRSVAPLGLIIVLQPYPGGSSLRSGAGGVHPVCGLSRLDFVDLWFGAYLADSNKIKAVFLAHIGKKAYLCRVIQ